MLFTEIIRKTQQRSPLSNEEITEFITSYSQDKIPDYQVSAWLMAVYLNGLNHDEIIALTTAIKSSGKSLTWENESWFQNQFYIADKHSTGGVGDKVSLILVPLAVHFGLKIPMMSGRSLGHTGGTVDKLESIPGFNMYLDDRSLKIRMRDFGAAMICQTEELCPADRRLYALRDVTSTIESIPLITASIVSKKWAEGVGTIVYDVKFGSGAFMESLERARTLAASLVDVSKKTGMRASALITRMEEPLGCMIGNRSEVLESMWILSNNYPTEDHRKLAAPLAKLCCETVAKLLTLSSLKTDYASAFKEVTNYLESGRAYESFLEMCHGQGAVKNWENDFQLSSPIWILRSKKSGYLESWNSRQLGLAGIELGMGRRTKEDKIDPSVSFEVHHQIGDEIKTGDKLLSVYSPNKELSSNARALLEDAYSVSSEKVLAKGPLLVETLD